MALADARRYKFVAKAFNIYTPELSAIVQKPISGRPTPGVPGPVGRFVRINYGTHAAASFWIEEKRWRAVVLIPERVELLESAGPSSELSPLRWALEVALGMLDNCGPLSAEPMAVLMTAAKLRGALDS